jgi:AcrR family transcriptional regulator
LSTSQRANGRDAPAGRPVDRILAATVDLLRSRGIAAVTTDAIAAGANVSKSSIYRRWRNKSEIIVSAIEEVITPVQIPDLGSFEAEVRYLLEIRRTQYVDGTNARVLRTFIGSAADDEVVRESFETWTSTQRLGALAMVRRGVERGEVHPAWELENLVTIIAAPTMFRAIIDSSAPTQSLVDDVITMVVRIAATDPRHD